MKLVTNTAYYGKVHRPDCNHRGFSATPWRWAEDKTREEIVATLSEDGASFPCVFCLPQLLNDIRDIRRDRNAAIRLGVTS